MKIGDHLIIIPDAFYTQSSLKIAFNKVLNTTFNGSLIYDISLNGNPYSSFKSTTDISISFAIKPSNTCSSITNKSGTTTADFDKYNIKSQLGWLLGFRNISYTISANSTIVSEALLDLTNPRYLYLIMDEFTNSNTNSFISPMSNSIMNKNILAKITMDYNHFSFGSVIVATATNGYLVPDVRSYNGKVNLQKLKIQLVNEYGNPVHLNGLDFSFCLEIDYE